MLLLKGAEMPHMVIFRDAEGRPGYHHADGIDEAVRFVEPGVPDVPLPERDAMDARQGQFHGEGMLRRGNNRDPGSPRERRSSMRQSVFIWWLRR